MEVERPRGPDRLEQVSRLLTLTAAALALIACVAAPLLALSWSNQPFPGFVVESTLVINDTTYPKWGGASIGLRSPQRLTRVDGQPVASSQEYRAALSALEAGQHVSVFTTLPDGSVRLYPSITLRDFPKEDLLPLFWLPYLAGLAYLGIGVWLYATKGQTRPGRALAFFCFATAVVSSLSFDLETTHALTDLWSVSIAMTGGALISLALRFPQEWRPAAQRAWLLGLPYVVSIALAGMGVIALHDATRPWGYVTAWRLSYGYALVGVVTFLAFVLVRSITGHSILVRQQARIVLLGSFLAFLPVTGWLAATAAGLRFPVDASLLLPILILFPLSVAIAIFRYRLFEVDVIVNRAVLYGTLTAVLAGLYTIAIMVSQRIFVVATGEKSDAAIVLTTLVVASAFTPARDRLKRILDTRLRDLPDSTRRLRSFSDDVRSYVEMRDATLLVTRLLEEASSALRAESGAVSLINGGGLQPVHTYGPWRGEAWVAVPLEWGGQRLGQLWLGPRLGREPYSRGEFEALQQAAQPAARALQLALGAPRDSVAVPGLLREAGDAT